MVTYNFVELTAPEKRYLTLLQHWLDVIPDSDVKTAISAVSWREMRPPPSWFRLIVVCRHPNPEDIEAFRRAKEQEDTEIVESVAICLLNNFENWITLSAMPRETIVDGRQAKITWSTEELWPRTGIQNPS